MNNITKEINILATVDRNYLPPLGTMLLSLVQNCTKATFHIYIAHSSLGNEDFEYLQSKTEGYDIVFHNIHVTEKWFSDTPVLERLPEESFYRLMAFHLLPEKVERCLYLDPDIIIRKDLTELYELDMGDNFIAAAGHIYGFVDKFNLQRLDIKNNTRYINSGVMLMNLDAIRKEFTQQIILDSLTENIQKLLLGDQDMANILFGSRTIFIDEKIYNLDERTFRHNKKDFTLDDVAEKTAIVHYNGKYKPWLEGYKGELDCFYSKVENKGPAPVGKKKAQAKAIYNIIRASKRQKILICGFLTVFAACLISWIAFGNEIVKIISDPILFRKWLDSFGNFDEIVFIAIRAVQTAVKFIPAEPLEIGSGYAWGAVNGMWYCLIANIIGSIAILYFTRRYGRRFVNLFLPSKNIEAVSVFSDVDKVYALLFLLYLIPGSPKDGFTYIVGLLNVKPIPFLVITSIARMPSILSSTLCGSTLADKRYLLSALIFAATAVLALIGGYLYHLYYNKKKESLQ